MKAAKSKWLIGAAVEDPPRFAGDLNTFKVICSDGRRVLHLRNLTAKQVSELDPERIWANVLTNTTKRVGGMK